MPLSWNEIKDRALAFSKEWETEVSEDAEAKTFWDQFFNVFGISRRRVASFEKPVTKGDGRSGYIDLLWKGVLLVEHKSRGRDLDRAFHQAMDYFPGLKERDLPRYVLVSDFARFRLYNLDTDECSEFDLHELYLNVRLFGFIAGYESRTFGAEDPVNVEAARHLGLLHDHLKKSGYDGHPLEVLLVRLLFCMFAEDTGLFGRNLFAEYLENRTSPDGADLGMHLARLFQVLDTPPVKRQNTLDEQLQEFPYVNGQLFSEMLPIADFNREMRETLLECCALDWSRISPAVFGSLFQSIMNAKDRRAAGAHYTTETHIMRLIRPLFLDDLWAEFERVKGNVNKLFEFQKRLGQLRFLDPACGCGNFLVIAYRELRLLELAVLRHVAKSRQMYLNIFEAVRVNVDQFFGIEIDEWPSRIAEVALWLTDHQMNMQVSEEYGLYFARLPLVSAPRIVCANALRIDWADVVPPEKLNFIMGNPPFVGTHFMSEAQTEDVARVFTGTKNFGLLDFVSCWYRKGAEFMQMNPAIRAAFVSTNSITMGEQVGVLWLDLYSRGVKIHFAHRTFQWSSEARGKAAVHCVIIGFGLTDVKDKWLFEYETLQAEPHALKAGNINPYLVDAPNAVVIKRTNPICNVPRMVMGNQPIDDGNYLFTKEEKQEFLELEPAAEPFFRRWMGSEEFINGIERWFLWIGAASPGELRKMPRVMERIEAVRNFRLKSKRPQTLRIAETPTRLMTEMIPINPYLLIPEVSSERRVFIPIGFTSPDVLSSNLVRIVADAQLVHFGVLQSTMHMAWTRAVCGRLESRYRYSASIVYNNFPWPDPTPAQKEKIEVAAQAVLDARAQFPTATLADLYDPLTMPPALLAAHRRLDAAVDAAYGRKSFDSESTRVAFLFDLYVKLTQPLAPVEKPAKKKPGRKKAGKDGGTIGNSD